MKINLLKMAGSLLTIFIASVIGCSSIHKEQIELMAPQITLSPTPSIQDTIKKLEHPPAKLMVQIAPPSDIKPADYNNIDSLRKFVYVQGNTIVYLIKRSSYTRDSLTTKIDQMRDTLNTATLRARLYYLSQKRSVKNDKLAEATNKVMDGTINYTFIFISVVVTLHYLTYLWDRRKRKKLNLS